MVGSVPVDTNFSNATQSKVVEKNGVVYASTLNQSNVTHNNNKFYVMQIIQTSEDYVFFCRWGRVGVVGQTSEMRSKDLDTLIRAYNTKLREKTNGGYRVVEMNY